MKNNNESLNEYGDDKPTNYSQNETNLYQKYKDNQTTIEGKRRFQGAAEGVPAISQEDFRLLRECNKESFWYRCFPLSAGICALMFYLAKQKNMRPKTLHILSGTFAGWFVGKLSYRRICEERLINSNSNSPFVNAMRRRKGVYREEFHSDTTLVSDAPPEATDPYWEQQSKEDNFGYGAHEFGDYREDDKLKDELEDAKPFTSYDDLRAKNRAAYKPRQFTSWIDMSCHLDRYLLC